MRIIDLVCLLLLLVPTVSAGPRKIRQGKASAPSRRAHAYTRVKLRDILHRQFNHNSYFQSLKKDPRFFQSFHLRQPLQLLNSIDGDREEYKSWEKNPLQFKDVKSSIQPLRPPQMEDANQIEIEFVRLTPPAKPAFVSLEDIRNDASPANRNFELEGEFVPTRMKRWKNVKREVQQREQNPHFKDEVDTHTLHAVSDYISQISNLKEIQDFLIKEPFETLPLDELYKQSDILFEARPSGTVPADFYFSSPDIQADAALASQEEFYFKVLPGSSLILAPNYIRPTYLYEAVEYYTMVLAHPRRPLHQKIRALTILGFLGSKGDGMADVILECLQHDFVDPPWTVDYAAGVALLNLGEAARFHDLIDWRMGLEAHQSKRTPGIAWLYNEVFASYDVNIEHLGEGIPAMRPETPEEAKITDEQLDYIRRYVTSQFEEMMWNLQDLDELVNFLQLKGLVLRRVNPTSEGETPNAQ